MLNILLFRRPLSFPLHSTAGHTPSDPRPAAALRAVKRRHRHPSSSLSPFLEDLVHENQHHPHEEQLAHDEDGVSSAEGRQGAVHPRNHEGDSLGEGQQYAEELGEGGEGGRERGRGGRWEGTTHDDSANQKGRARTIAEVGEGMGKWGVGLLVRYLC